MLFTDETAHIFTYTACVHLLRAESPEMEVCEVTKEPPQHGRRKRRLCREGRCLWAGGSDASIHFVSFSSAGNERWIHKTPLGLKKNGCSHQSLMVTEKCARQHSGDPDISQGQVPAPSFHYIRPGTRLETSKLPQNTVIAEKNVADRSVDNI